MAGLLIHCVCTAAGVQYVWSIGSELVDCCKVVVHTHGLELPHCRRCLPAGGVDRILNLCAFMHPVMPELTCQQLIMMYYFGQYVGCEQVRMWL